MSSSALKTSNEGNALATASISKPLPITNEPGHLIKVPSGPWTVWKWFWLRAAGFSSELVVRLSAPECGAAAERALRLQAEVECSRQEAASEFRRAFNGTTDAEQRKILSRGLKKLSKGQIPDPAGPEMESCRQKLMQDVALAEEAMKLFTEQYQSAVQEKSGIIRKIASDGRFRRAVLLQNRGAVHLGIDALLRHADRRGKKERQHEELVANYLQRYCLKNDTIGFFGPVGWARFSSQTESIAALPGPELTATSAIFFENWGIEALAGKMVEDPALRPWLAPRCSPLIHFESSSLQMMGIPPIPLTPLQAAILTRCKGETTAVEIARDILAMGFDTTQDHIYELLHDFCRKKIITWSAEIPITLHPEKVLLGLLQRIEPDDLREPLVRMVEELDGARAEVAACIDDPEKLDQALGNLDQTFTRLTSKTSTKSAGAMYAGRTLIYQDCRRDMRMDVGLPILEELGPALTILLQAARWFTYQAAATYREAFEQIHAEMTAQKGSSQIDLPRFWSRIEFLIFHPEKRLFNRVLSSLQEKWSEILRVPERESRLHYRSSELKPMVDAQFSAPRPGWSLARYHSPDVMIAASSIDEIRKTNYFFVLGEIHMAQNTLRYSLNVSQHPAPADLFRAIQDDLPRPRVLLVPPRRWPRVTNRMNLVLRSPHDYLLELSGDARADSPRANVLSFASLLVERTAEGLVIRTRDGKTQFDVIEFLGEILSAACIDLMKVQPSRQHSPRIMIDRLVICRESWSFSATGLSFVSEENEHQRFLLTRRWKLNNHLPRFVFVRLPTEVKPFYLDFDSPIYVEMFLKGLKRLVASDRAAEPMTISEMLPAPDQLWLPDSQGLTYTSEFRIAVKDTAEA